MTDLPSDVYIQPYRAIGVVAAAREYLAQLQVLHTPKGKPSVVTTAMSFYASDQEQAEREARIWWEAECERQRKSVANRQAHSERMRNAKR